MPPLAAYMTIRRYVIDLMRKHAEQDVRIMSERELCEKFDVTRPTVRRALKDLVDEGFLITRQGSGTFINPGKVMNHTFLLRKSFSVMVIMGGGVQVDLDGFFLAILERICCFFKTLPINLRIVNVNTTDQEEALQELEMHNVDGILWIRPGAHNAPLVATARSRIPVYAVGDIAEGRPFHVTADYGKGGYLAAKWFLERNLRHIAFVGGTNDQSVKHFFYEGWKSAFAEAGYVHDENLNAEMKSNICQRIRALAEGGMIDGIFSFGSEFAAVDTTLAEMGVPTDRYPVMIDENYYGDYGARIKPVAKVIFPLEEITTLAAEHLFKALGRPGHRLEEMVLPCQIREGAAMKRGEAALVG